MLLAGNSFAKEPNSNETTKIETPAEPKILSVKDVTTALKDAQISITATQAFRGGLAEAINGIKELIARLKEGSLSQEDRQRINDLEKNLEDLQQKLDAETDSKNTAKEELKDEQDAHGITRGQRDAAQRILDALKRILKVDNDAELEPEAGRLKTFKIKIDNILVELKKIIPGITYENLYEKVKKLFDDNEKNKPILATLKELFPDASDDNMPTEIRTLKGILDKLKEQTRLDTDEYSEFPEAAKTLRNERNNEKQRADNNQNEIDNLKKNLESQKKLLDLATSNLESERKKALEEIKKLIENANKAEEEAKQKLVDEKAAKEEAERKLETYEKSFKEFIKNVENRSISWRDVVAKFKSTIPKIT
jgi:chromosome segregation ATPase